MPSEPRPVWFITGCSSGFGREISVKALSAGHSVVLTARNSSSISDLVRRYGSQALALDLDVTDKEQIARAAKRAEDHFGRVDILVNNAGYGYQCSAEEGEEEEIRDLFETNVFGLFAMTRALLPGMRKHRYGRIVNITSVAGIVGFEGSSYYAATKHAIEGWSDALAAECNPLGIRVMCVEPGRFRTDWAGRSLHRTESKMEDYANTVRTRMQATAKSNGTQPGDPARAADLIVGLCLDEDPPRNIALGARAIAMATQRLKAKLADIEAFRQRGTSTDFPGGVG